MAVYIVAAASMHFVASVPMVESTCWLASVFAAASMCLLVSTSLVASTGLLASTLSVMSTRLLVRTSAVHQQPDLQSQKPLGTSDNGRQSFARWRSSEAGWLKWQQRTMRASSYYS